MSKTQFFFAGLLAIMISHHDSALFLLIILVIYQVGSNDK